MKLQTILMSAVAFAALAACTPAAETPAPAAPLPADIAAATPESGPAAENTTDTLASAPPADATAVAPAATPAATTPATPAAAPPAAAPKADLAAGAAVYTRTCAMCHGPAGEGTVMGVALTTPHEAAKVKEKIVKGPINSGDKMPPLGAAMSAEDLDAVSAYVAAGLKL